MDCNGWIVVTGANSGMGRVLAESLVKRGYRVIMACRNLPRSEPVYRELAAGCPDRVRLLRLDLSSFDSIISFTGILDEENIRVSVLVNNAGVMNRDFLLTQDGFEQNLGINYLAPFLLTCRLLPLIPRGGHILNIASCTYRFGKVSKHMFVPDVCNYDRFRSYSTSKQALILFSLELAQRLGDSGIMVNAVDPGVVDTGIITMHRWFDPLTDIFFRPLILSPEQGISRTLRLIIGDVPENISGMYWGRKRPIRLSSKILHHPYRKNLWADTEKVLRPWL